MFRRWLTSTLILFIALMANSSAQEETTSSSNSHQDIPVRSETSGAEHHRESNDSYWRPHFHSVHNIQVQGCCGTGATSASDLDRVLNATRTVLDNMTRAILDNVTLTVLNMIQNQESNNPGRDTPRHTPAPIAISSRPRDCAEIQDSGVSTSGVYPIYPDGGGNPFFVSCDMETDGGGWTVFQRRQDGSVDFYLNWADYKYGFGNLSTEHWLGNDNIHRLTTQKTYELRVDLEDFSEQTRYARYSSFHVSDEDENYLMKTGDYSGDAGDSLSAHSCHQFTTKDRDNDEYSGNCASSYKGGWWYYACHYANLNGLYNTDGTTGIVWYHWLGHGSGSYLKKSEMKIRPL